MKNAEEVISGKFNVNNHAHIIKGKYFNEDKLKDLAANVENDGLIEPIIIRSKNDRY